MKSQTTDRRVLRSRLALQRALIDLIVERGYEELTVQHILDRAGIGRSTFYAHFRDKEDLFVSSIENLKVGLIHWWKAELAAGKPKGELAFVEPFLRHFDGNRTLSRAMIGSECGRIFEREFRVILSDLVRRDLGLGRSNKPATEAAVACVVGSLFALMEAWIDGRVNGTPAEVSAMFLRLTLPGLASIAKP